MHDKHSLAESWLENCWHSNCKSTPDHYVASVQAASTDSVGIWLRLWLTTLTNLRVVVMETGIGKQGLTSFNHEEPNVLGDLLILNKHLRPSAQQWLSLTYVKLGKHILEANTVVRKWQVNTVWVEIHIPLPLALKTGVTIVGNKVTTLWAVAQVV